MLPGSTHGLKLQDGSRIAVIGGGPAGSFFALHALARARQRGLSIQIVIFEPKDFTRRGPTGCNKCAGILSSRLVHNLETLDLALPPEVIMGEIKAYVLHLGGGAVEIRQPEPWRRIVSVYRGAGPRLGNLPASVSFDNWLLSQAQQRGAQVIRERVTEVRMGDRPLIIAQDSSLSCDLVVLATGVNSRPVRMPDLSYVPPATEIMSQDELAIANMTHDHRVHVYTGQPAGTLFGGLVPKGTYVNVSLLGHKLSKDVVGKFLEADGVQKLLATNPGRLCGCNPKIAVSMARDFYADRFVAVGDAAVTRLYKDGIGSAFLTAGQAARVALEMGISAETFRQGYEPFCRGIDRDNRIGRLLFSLWEGTTLSSRRIGQAWLHALMAEERLPPERQHCRRAIWGMFTGDDSYRNIARQAFHPVASFRLFVGYLRTILQAGQPGQSED